MVKSSHRGVDDLAGVLGSLPGQVKVDHGGLEGAVPHGSLDNSRVHAILEKVGRIAVAERVHRDLSLDDSGCESGRSEGTLDRTYGHGTLGGLPPIAASAESREKEGGIPVSGPVAAQQLAALFGERNSAVLRPFAPMDMHHHPVAVDIRHLEAQGLRDPEPAGVDHGKTGKVLKRLDVLQDPEDFFPAEDGRKSVLLFGPETGEDVPFTLEDLLKEELDVAHGNAQSS